MKCEQGKWNRVYDVVHGPNSCESRHISIITQVAINGLEDIPAVVYDNAKVFALHIIRLCYSLIFHGGDLFSLQSYPERITHFYYENFVITIFFIMKNVIK